MWDSEKPKLSTNFAEKSFFNQQQQEQKYEKRPQIIHT